MAENAQAPAQNNTQAGQSAQDKPAPTPQAESTQQSPPAEQKPVETKPTEQKPVVPEKYDLKLPEGSRLDNAYVAQVAEYAKQKGMTNEQAQELLNREHGAVGVYEQGLLAQHKKRAFEEWPVQVQNDQEIGGVHFKENIELSKRLIKRHGTPEFEKLLDESGYGNHPEVVRFISRIAKTMSEDQLIIPGAQTGMTKRSPAEILYGETKE